MNKINTFITGTTGATATAYLPELLTQSSIDDIQIIMQIIIQMVIGAITIAKLLTKDKSKNLNK